MTLPDLTAMAATPKASGPVFKYKCLGEGCFILRAYIFTEEANSLHQLSALAFNKTSLNAAAPFNPLIATLETIHKAGKMTWQFQALSALVTTPKLTFL